MTEDEIALEKYKAELRRQEIQYEADIRHNEMHWQTQNDRIEHIDRAAIDIGLAANKIAILLNGGALVAVLALVGQLWDRDRHIVSQLIPKSTPFVRGLICGFGALCIAYVYQSIMTVWAQNELKKLSKVSYKKIPFLWIAALLAILMLIFAAGSFWGFVLGLVKVASVLL
jgi:hypothetical protein